jgi:predicted nucleotidyltransferase
MARRAVIRLFPKLQDRILGLLLIRPDREWYRSELARELEVQASTLQRPLAALVAAGILRSRRDGNRLYYQADTQSPLFPELRGLLAKTSGLAGVLKEALASVASKIRVAFVYGSIASGEERSSSDVDLLVVGDIGLAELASPLRRAAIHLGREVNPTVYSEREFAEKLQSRNRFLQGILDKPKVFVVGRQDDLGGTPRPEESGERRSRRTGRG